MLASPRDFAKGSLPSSSSSGISAKLVSAPLATRKTVEKFWLYEAPEESIADMPMHTAMSVRRMAMP